MMQLLAAINRNFSNFLRFLYVLFLFIFPLSAQRSLEPYRYDDCHQEYDDIQRIRHSITAHAEFFEYLRVNDLRQAARSSACQ